MKIFDIHAHIYPETIAPRAVQALKDGYDGIEVKGDGTLGTLVSIAESAGIDKLAVHAAATALKQVDSVNRFIMDAAKAHPGKIVPFGTLHPDMDDPARAVEQMAAEGFKGIKLHPELQGFRVDDAKGVRLFAAAAGKLPVLLHCGDYRFDHSAPERIQRMLKEVKGLKLICAHLGGWTQWEQAAWLLRDEDVMVDSSSSLYALDEATAVGIIRSYGADRVLFGSDFPVWNPAEEAQRLLTLPLTDAEKEQILWGNAEKLFGQEK